MKWVIHSKASTVGLHVNLQIRSLVSYSFQGIRGEPGFPGLPGLPGPAGLRGLVSRIILRIVLVSG